MSFSILYPDGSSREATLVHNLYSLATYMDRLAVGMGIQQLNIDPARLTRVVGALATPDFPHRDGIGKASPFKKAAHFFVYFVAEKPIMDELFNLNDQIRGIDNHQNVIFAYQMAVDCLHGATLQKKENGNEVSVTLSNKIRVSEHFFMDFVEAHSACVPRDDFKPVSLLFEQLAYRANPNASYDLVV